MQFFALLNLLCIFVYVPWRIIPVARQGERNLVIWVLAGMGGWIGAHIAVALCYAPIPWLGLQHWGWTAQTLEWGIFVARALGLAAALLAVEFIRWWLSGKP
jgi:hypothetical protein